MAINIVRAGVVGGYRLNDNYKEFLIDSASDVESLPTNVQPGSVAYSADGTLRYTLSNGGVWTLVVQRWISSNDYTDAEKTKLAGIAAGADVTATALKTASIIAGYDATKTQVLKHESGTLKWVDEV